MDSNNNNKDSNNNYNVTETLNNHSSNSICLVVWVESFHLMFESVQIIQVFLMGLERLFHIEGPFAIRFSVPR